MNSQIKGNNDNLYKYYEMKNKSLENIKKLNLTISERFEIYSKELIERKVVCKKKILLNNKINIKEGDRIEIREISLKTRMNRSKDKVNNNLNYNKIIEFVVRFNRTYFFIGEEEFINNFNLLSNKEKIDGEKLNNYLNESMKPSIRKFLLELKDSIILNTDCPTSIGDKEAYDFWMDFSKYRKIFLIEKGVEKGNFLIPQFEDKKNKSIIISRKEVIDVFIKWMKEKF